MNKVQKKQNKNSRELRFSQEAEISYQTNVKLFSVDQSDWDRIKRLIHKIDCSGNFWQNFGWFMMASCLACFIAIFTVNIFWIPTSFCFFIAIINFCVSKKISKTRENSKSDVLSEMDQMEEKIKKEE